MDGFLDSILQMPNGARFYRVDLHNHTPFDRDFHCGNHPIDTEAQKAAFADRYVRFLKREQAIDIVGITEHNDISWLSYIQEAARDAGLMVLPGVELGARGGKRPVHILALFNPDKSAEEIDHFISTLDLEPHERFHPDSSPCAVKRDVQDLLAHIVEKGGIPIAAHASSANGLFTELASQARLSA